MFPSTRRVVQWAERGLLLVGLLLVGLWLEDRREAYAFQSAASHRLEAALHRDMLSGPPAPGNATREAARGPRPGSSLGRIEIPRLRISAMIAEGTGTDVLERAVGHVTGTARPGSPGNMGLAGHRDSFFRGIGGAHENDLVRIVTVDTAYRYRVAWTAIVEPRRVDVLDSTVTPSLTLVTCYPFHWVGPAPKRFIVRAVRADAPEEDAP
jgi:sortase A